MLVNSSLAPTIWQKNLNGLDLRCFFKEIQHVESLLKIDFNINKKDVESVERKTRAQHKSKLWYKFRARRITASQFKSCCTASHKNASSGLIKRIINPEKFRFSSKFTNWGHANESNAVVIYVNLMEKNHKYFKIKSPGLIISIETPYFPASPDRLVSCDCCHEGILEVKCPYLPQFNTFKKLEEKKKFCLENQCLKYEHSYHYQCQMLMVVTKRGYCDFLVWSPIEEPHLERVLPDNFFWNLLSTKAAKFYETCIMPNLLK